MNILLLYLCNGPILYLCTDNQSRGMKALQMRERERQRESEWGDMFWWQEMSSILVWCTAEISEWKIVDETKTLTNRHNTLLTATNITQYTRLPTSLSECKQASFPPSPLAVQCEASGRQGWTDLRDRNLTLGDATAVCSTAGVRVLSETIDLESANMKSSGQRKDREKLIKVHNAEL